MTKLAATAGTLVLAVLAGACGMPATVADRRALPSCGRNERVHEPLTAAQREQSRCLLEAYEAGEPAELVVVEATIEGDPITTYVRVLGERRIELFIDTTADSGKRAAFP